MVQADLEPPLQLIGLVGQPGPTVSDLPAQHDRLYPLGIRDLGERERRIGALKGGEGRVPLSFFEQSLPILAKPFCLLR